MVRANKDLYYMCLFLVVQKTVDYVRPLITEHSAAMAVVIIFIAVCVISCECVCVCMCVSE